MSFIELLKKRRTIYALNDQVNVDRATIEKTITEVVRHSPSAFNSQSSRLLVLFSEEQSELWEITKATLRPLVPAENFAATEEKLDGFTHAFGTALFFEDTDVVKTLQEQFPTYAEHFPAWSEHSTGIAQINVWLALTDLGLGANLQHYDPVIDQEIAKRWNIPAHWKLRAEMNFGNIVSPAGEKAFIDDTHRIMFRG